MNTQSYYIEGAYNKPEYFKTIIPDAVSPEDAILQLQELMPEVTELQIDKCEATEKENV